MIDDRLKTVMDQVKPNTSLPLIIQVQGKVVPTMLQELAGSGLTGIRSSSTFPYIYGKGTESVINLVSKLAFVARVSYDEPVYSHGMLNVPFESEVRIPLGDAIKLTGAPDLWEQGLTGKGIKVGVIDTGVSTEHEMIKPVLKGTFTAVPDSTPEDEQSHGSWCCSAVAGQIKETPQGILFGAAPGASLYSLKALSDDGKGQMSWVMDCIEQAVHTYQCDILSLSLGSLYDNGGADPISHVINTIAKENNVIPVIAAGNSFVPMSIGSPGGATMALTVGAVSVKTPQKYVASTFSSKGPTTVLTLKPDIAAPGGNIMPPKYVESILGAAKHGQYVAMSGTSMATPIVAGCMALLRQAKNDLSRTEIEGLMAAATMPAPKNTFVGYGPIDVRMLFKNLGKTVPGISAVQNLATSLQMGLYAPLALLPRQESNDIRAVRLN